MPLGGGGAHYSGLQKVAKEAHARSQGAGVIMIMACALLLYGY